MHFVIAIQILAIVAIAIVSGVIAREKETLGKQMLEAFGDPQGVQAPRFRLRRLMGGTSLDDCMVKMYSESGVCVPTAIIDLLRQYKRLIRLRGILGAIYLDVFVAFGVTLRWDTCVANPGLFVAFGIMGSFVTIACWLLHKRAITWADRAIYRAGLKE